MGSFNLFRVAADICHVLSKFTLMWAIHWNRSAEGVSLITQVLYIFVFISRYLDIFSLSPFHGEYAMYLFSAKLFYIGTSLYIVFLMMFVYARTREREKAWKFGMWCLIVAAVLALPVNKIFEKGPWITVGGVPKRLYEHDFVFTENLWTFSIILESICVLPQLLLLRQTTVPTVFDSYYLILLGSYRALYLVGWIWRAADPTDYHFDPVSVVFGALQTALYIDFAWVYYGRQRVKLRAGGIVDADDLGRGWLVGRLVGKHAPGVRGARPDEHDEEEGDDDEEGNGNGLGPDVERGAFANRSGRSNRWGPRGISVSADEGVVPSGDDAVPLADPDAFEDELSDDEGAPQPRKATVEDSPWQDEPSRS